MAIHTKWLWILKPKLLNEHDYSLYSIHEVTSPLGTVLSPSKSKFSFLTSIPSLIFHTSQSIVLLQYMVIVADVEAADTSLLDVEIVVDDVGETSDADRSDESGQCYYPASLWS